MMATLENYKEAVKRNNAIISATREAIYEYDIKSDSMVYSDSLLRMFGLTNQVGIGKWWRGQIHPEDRERVINNFRKAKVSNIVSTIEEYRLKTAVGKYNHVLHSVYLLKNNKGQIYRTIGAIQDVTELRQLETEYHEQRLNQKMEIARSIMSAEERERNRWAEELHDNITQILSVASLYTSMLTQEHADVPATAGKIREMIQHSVDEIRDLSANLKPPMFQSQSLKDAIEWLTSNIKDAKRFHISTKVDEQIDILLTEDQKLMIYRIIQEQLHNIVKHADASAVVITVEARGNMVVMQVTDDGKGFDRSFRSEGTGFKNMRSRLELFEGGMEIHSSPGKGCKMEARFHL